MKVAIIFAAGVGSRLNPLTKTIHKTLIKINQIPLIEYLINNLLTLKTLKKIIVITGYRHENFLYLEKKYLNLKIIFNAHYQEYQSAYVLSLLTKDVFCHDLFFISGDFVMKENCFNDSINGNFMAAMKRVNSKEDWSYKLNQNTTIVDLTKSNDGLLASEWTHINKEWSKKIAKHLDQEQILLKTTMIGKYLINCSIRDKVILKPYLLAYNNFWDLDDDLDLQRIKKYF